MISIVEFMAQVMDGTKALSRALQPFEDLLKGNMTTPLDAIIANVSAGANPARILTTGFGAGNYHTETSAD